MLLQPPLKNLHAGLLNLIEDGVPVALATIIDTSGSTPQVPGFSALFTARGLGLGTLGGGILEKDAEARAKAGLEAGRSQLYTYALDADPNTPEGAICGGSARILIDAAPAVHAPAVRALCESQRARIPGVLATHISGPDENPVLRRRWIPERQEGPAARGSMAAGLRGPVASVLERRRARLFRGGDLQPGSEPGSGVVFLEPIFPLPRLVIAGAGHIGKAVAHLGHRLEFEVTVIDDRPEFANAENLPDADSIIVGDIGSSMAELDPGPETYIVIATRGHRHDGEALRACISASCAYLGMIGSRTKITLMRDRFLDEGWASPGLWGRVHAPIGIEIGSQTVEEIAISIAAQLVEVRSRKSLGKHKA